MIPVKDQQNAKEFYLKLDFQLVAQVPSAHGQTWMLIILPNNSTTLSLASLHGIICETEDIDKDIIKLNEKGINVEKIDDTPWGRFAWLKDLDGNNICLQQK